MTIRPTPDSARQRSRGESAHGHLPRVCGQVLVVIPILALAWLFGGVQSSHQFWLYVMLVPALACLVWRSLSGRRRTAPLSTALIPLSLGILVGLCQLLPLPSALQAQIAPRNHALWQTLLPMPTSLQQVEEAELPNGTNRNSEERRFAGQLGVAGLPAQTTISLYPASTRHDLALLVAAVAVFFIASRLFSSSKALLLLFFVVALNGAALSFFGLAQQLRWNGLLFGTVPLSEGGAPFASFVNRNSGAGYLNMCLGAALGITIWVFASARPGEGEYWDSESILQRCTRFLSQLNPQRLAALCLGALIFSGVVCSLSRGGWISCAAAAGITWTVVCLTHRVWGRVSLLVAAGVLGLALVAWVGRVDTVQQRLATLWNHGQRPDSRWAHWENGLHAASDFVTTGSGLGTYRFAYKLYERNGSQSWFYHAENQYLEALVEGGVPGLLLLLVTLAFVFAACLRLIRQPPSSGPFCCGVAALFILVSQAVHAGFDFGLYMPANMALLALISGAVCGMAALLPVNPEVPSRARRWHGLSAAGWLGVPAVPGVPLGLAVLLAAGVTWAGTEISRASQVESVLRASRTSYERDAVSVEQLDELLASLEQVIASQPDQAEAYQVLGQLWIHRYRLDAFHHLELDYPPDVDRGPLWNVTSTVNLHRTVSRLRRDDPDGELRKMRRADDVRTHLANAARALLAARRGCPLLVKPHLLLAEIVPAISVHGDDAPHLERAIQLSIGDHDLLVEAGLLASQSDQNDLACDLWRRSIEILPERYYRVLDLAAEQPRCAGRVAELIPDSPELIIQVGREYFTRDEDAASRTQLGDRAYQLLTAVPELDLEQKYYLQGAALLLAGRNAEALEPFLRALQLRPGDTLWRHEYARALAGAGQLEEAEEQAAICCKLEPANEKYLDFQKDLIRRRLGGGAPFDRHNRSTGNDTSQKVRTPAEYSLVESRR